MTLQTNRPLIIKRKKVVGGDGHHGGAWKVAYADFVTAMMAFFMLMWLLNATTEQQRKGIADYFAPSIPISRVSGGGDGLFGGTILMTEDPDAEDGVGGENGPQAPAAMAADGEAGRTPEVAALRELEAQLLGIGGESLLSEQALRHVVTRLTDEGLVIEVFSLPGEPIFTPGTDQPTSLTRHILEVVARVSAMVVNPVAVGAHVPTRTVVLADNKVWDITAGRAEVAREVLETADLPAERIRRVTAHGDRSPASPDATALRNDRIEVTLIRTGAS